MRQPTTNIDSGRQLRAARVLAGLTQAQLAQQAGFHERACRYWEAQGDDPPTSTPSSLAIPQQYARVRVMGLRFRTEMPANMEFVSVTTVVRCPRTGRACPEVTCRDRHCCRKMLERGLSHTGLPLKRIFRPRCCAKTRAGAPCIMRVVPGKRRCRFHGGLSTGPRTVQGKARIAEAQRRRWGTTS